MSERSRYVLFDRLGRGGMADVFRAGQCSPVGTVRPVAIKRMRPAPHDPGRDQMFLDEAAVALQLQHPNIVRVYEVDTIEDQLGIVMEYVPGRTVSQLQESLATRGETLPLSLALHIAFEVACGLSRAHNTATPAGVSVELVHRDIKPSNIILGYDGSVRILDFGVSRSRWNAVRTAPGTIKGTLGYMSPEQLEGDRVSRASDVFSLGVVLHELLTGERLYQARTALEHATILLFTDAPATSTLRPEVSAELDEVLATALARDPRDRYPGGLAFAQALSQLADLPRSFTAEADLRRLLAEHFTEQQILERLTLGHHLRALRDRRAA